MINQADKTAAVGCAIARFPAAWRHASNGRQLSARSSLSASGLTVRTPRHPLHAGAAVPVETATAVRHTAAAIANGWPGVEGPDDP